VEIGAVWRRGHLSAVLSALLVWDPAASQIHSSCLRAASLSKADHVRGVARAAGGAYNGLGLHETVRSVRVTVEVGVKNNPLHP
jgi:hypothetical protein